MKDLERTWNHKFNYPWTFLNDKPFTAEFKKRTQEVTKAKCRYGKDDKSAKEHLSATDRYDRTSARGTLGRSRLD